MKKLLLLFFVCTCMYIHINGTSVLTHSKAVFAGRAGDHVQAQQLLQRAVIAAPQDASVLYDAGVAAFKCGNHADAVNYFEKAEQYASQDEFRQEALFNAGNAYAHLKKYDNALKSYEKILSQNPAHERARHNYELVKKMKEQEEAKQNQEDKDDQSDQDNKDQQEQGQDQSSNQDQNQDQKNDQQDDENSSQDNKSSNNKKNKDGGNGSSEGKNSEDNQDADASDQSQASDTNDTKSDNKNSSSPDEEKPRSGNDQQRNQSPTQPEKPSNDKNKPYNNAHEDQYDRHENSSPQQKPGQVQSNSSVDNTQSQAQAFAQQHDTPEELAGADKQWMRSALEACDKQDNTHNKQLLKAVVGTDKGDRRAVRAAW